MSEFADALQNHEITQGLLEIAISETTPSLKMIDMSVFDNWEKTIGS